jgi:hypothetical protein
MRGLVDDHAFCSEKIDLLTRQSGGGLMSKLASTYLEPSDLGNARGKPLSMFEFEDPLRTLLLNDGLELDIPLYAAGMHNKPDCCLRALKNKCLGGRTSQERLSAC